MSDRDLVTRVVKRFAAGRPMKPEKLQALLLKLRKGAGTSLKIKDLIPVFDHLGGWKIEDHLVLVPESRNSFTPVSEVRTYSRPHSGDVETTWNQAKANEVKRLPDPETMKPYTMVYMDVSDITPMGNGVGFTYRAWQVNPGTKITAPDRKSLVFHQKMDQVLNSYPSNLFGNEERVGEPKRFSEWLNKETPFLDQINTKLGMPSYQHELEQKRTKYIKNDENLGTCPCCFGHFKLLPKTRKGKDKSMPGMVLHGYKRPGTGYVHGNCFGQDWPPFELSSEGAVAFLEQIEQSIDNVGEALKNLKSGKITSVYDLDKKREIKEGDPEFQNALKQKVLEYQGTLDSLILTKSIVKRHLDGWKPKPLPGAGDVLKRPGL